MEPANNKLAALFAALVIGCSFAAPASATVNNDRWRGHASEQSIILFFNELGIGGWRILALSDTRDFTSSSTRCTRHR